VRTDLGMGLKTCEFPSHNPDVSVLDQTGRTRVGSINSFMIIDTDASDRGGAETLRGYELNGAYDEMFSAADHPRKQYRQLYNLLLSLGPGELRRCKHEADQSFLKQGITFTV
jgi:hypothetical protein